jgi:FMN-dependent NADH-azoreductase
MGYELGACQINYDSTDLGKTFGGVSVALSESTVQLKTDQDGETPVDEIIVGTQVVVTGNLADIDLDTIATLTKQTKVTDTNKEKVEITTNMGTSLLTEAKVLIIKPYVGGSVSTNANTWITLALAGLKVTSNLAYNASDQRVLAFEATGYASSTGLVATFGDTTVT